MKQAFSSSSVTANTLTRLIQLFLLPSQLSKLRGCAQWASLCRPTVGKSANYIKSAVAATPHQHVYGNAEDAAVSRGACKPSYVAGDSDLPLKPLKPRHEIHQHVQT